MKENCFHELKAMFGKKYGSFLMTRSETLEDIKKEIDEANNRAVSLGYNKNVFTIIYCEYKTYLDDYDNFTGREITETVIGYYPEEI